MKEHVNPKKIDECLLPGKTIVLFILSYCPYSRAFKPIFQKYAEKNKDKCGFSTAIIDDYDCPMWSEYKIEAVPTVLVFENGKVIRRLDGRHGEGLDEEDLNSI
jgi:thioredoxin 1